jgi:hypothetical protein
MRELLVILVGDALGKSGISGQITHQAEPGRFMFAGRLQYAQNSRHPNRTAAPQG